MTTYADRSELAELEAEETTVFRDPGCAPPEVAGGESVRDALTRRPASLPSQEGGANVQASARLLRDGYGPRLWALPQDVFRDDAGSPNAAGASDGRSEDFDECLAEVVENDLIPRLLHASAAAATEPSNAIGEPETLDRFCRVLLSEGLESAMGVVDGLRGAGVSIADIYSGYVAGAARRLGVLWEEDALSFTEVSAGLTRLHAIVRRLSPAFATPGTEAAGGRSALFAVAPGETHALGVVIAAEHFARAGWRLKVDLGPEPDGLIRDIARERFDVVGLSISANRHLDSLRRTIEAVRRTSPAAMIVLGGSLLAERPELETELRPDLVCTDPETAAACMTSLLDSAG